jgi:Flp pilus assembly protein CpaB
MTYRVKNIVLAVALAGVAAVMTSFYVANYRKSVTNDEKNVAVWVAKNDIPAGISGAEARSRGLLEETKVARRTVVPGAITTPSQVDELVAGGPIYKGEQLSARRFKPVEQIGIQGELKGNMRAFQISGDGNQLLAGTLKRGDRVDVVSSVKYKVRDIGGTDDRDRVATRIVLRDVLVLDAEGGSLAAEKVNGNGSNHSVQLAVTDAQTQKLFFVTKNTDWSLQLRPVVDATDSPESVETLESVLGDGLRDAQFQQLYGGRR